MRIEPEHEEVRRAKAATRQYIKRQLTWWRGHMRGEEPWQMI